MGAGEGGAGGGLSRAKCKKHQLIIVMKKYCPAVHEVRPDLEETGQPRELLLYLGFISSIRP